VYWMKMDELRVVCSHSNPRKLREGVW
jgi:hypothetical protein